MNKFERTIEQGGSVTRALLAESWSMKIVWWENNEKHKFLIDNSGFA